jgi:hypothetical protein
MKKFLSLIVLVAIAYSSKSQTLYVPSGTLGISSTVTGNTNVGIGTTSPVSKLNINHTIMEGAQTTFAGTAANAAMALGVSSKTDTKLLSGIGAFSYAWMQVQNVNNAPYNLVLNPIGGNIGIGTTTPTQKLTVENKDLSINSVAGFYNNIDGRYAQGNGAAINLGLNANCYYAKIAAVFENSFSLWLNPALAFYTMNNTTNAGSEVERMRITSSGNVGIGTTTPTQKLTVAGGNIACINYGNWLGVASIGGTYARILGTDIALSGTNMALVTTNGYVNTNDGLLKQDNTSLPTWALALDATNDALYIKRAAAGSTAASALTKLLTINSSGAVGIGTTTPDPRFKLDVRGTVNSWGQVIADPNKGDYEYGLYIQAHTSLLKAIGVVDVNGNDMFRVYGNGIVNAQKIYTGSLVVVVDPFAYEWFDKVFSPEYKLQPLHDVDRYIKEHRHLSDIPSEAQVRKDGINLAEMDGLLLKKIEELTLYLIEQQKEIDSLKEKISEK